MTVRPFFIGASPITQAQWTAVVMTHSDKTSYALQPFPSFFKGDRLPVESITWNEADEFFIAPDNPGWQGRIGLRVICML